MPNETRNALAIHADDDGKMSRVDIYADHWEAATADDLAEMARRCLAALPGNHPGNLTREDVDYVNRASDLLEYAFRAERAGEHARVEVAMALARVAAKLAALLPPA